MIVESLFDFRPDHWYGVDGNPRKLSPPPWSKASTDVLRQTLQLADQALKWDIPAATKASVKKTQKEIEGILKERAAKEKKAK